MDKNRRGANASYVALIIFAAVWMLLPSAVRRFNREAFAEFQAPALVLASKGRDLARYWELKSRGAEELAAASRDLARANAALELKLAATEDIRQENIRLREILRYPAPEGYRSVVARVATREGASWWHRLVIRKGRNDGVRPGCPVVFSDRVVGRVSVVHLYTSEVDLVTSPGFRCTANLEGDDQNNVVMLTGAPGNSLGRARARISVIPYDYTPPAGNPNPKVYTTGMGGVFPGRLVLGTLESGLQSTPQGNFKEGYLRPSRDLNTLQEVSVLVPLRPPPGEMLLDKLYEELQ